MLGFGFFHCCDDALVCVCAYSTGARGKGWGTPFRLSKSMTRNDLPNRRHGVTMPVTFKNHEFAVTYNRDDDGIIREAFMRATKEGNDLSALLTDGCIAMSMLLQHGETMDSLAAAFGEDRQERESSGPPSSALGAIARAGAALEREAQHEA